MEILFIIIFCLQQISTKYNVTSIKPLMRSLAFPEIQKIFMNGSMNGYLTLQEYQMIIDSLKNEFPHILEVNSIGKTFQNRDIYVISFNKSNSSTGILFTGMHHAREPVSFMMNINLIFKILYEIENGNSGFMELVETRNIYFIPIINPDGYNYNIQKFTESGTFSYMRKNNRYDMTFLQCDDAGVGVDLNRNYDYMFANDDIGSGRDTCSEDYRGPKAFSEAETTAIKNFIEKKNSSIKIAFNYHSFGNLLIHPFNYDNINNENLKANFKFFYDRYDEFLKEGQFPNGIKKGNGLQTINYSANGEASDWMLGRQNILAFSPELGMENEPQVFYPAIDVALDIINNNIRSAIYGIERSGFYLKIEPINLSYNRCQNSDLCTDSFNVKFFLKNTGFGKMVRKIPLYIKVSNVSFSKLLISQQNQPAIELDTSYDKTGLYEIGNLESMSNVELQLVAYIKEAEYNNFTLLIFIGESSTFDLNYNSPKYEIRSSDFITNTGNFRVNLVFHILIPVIAILLIISLLYIFRNSGFIKNICLKFTKGYAGMQNEIETTEQKV